MNNGKRLYPIVVSMCLFLMVQMSLAANDNVSDAVKANLNTLVQTNGCPGCDLSGANLNRMSLSGANLEGANLFGAKIFLADLTRANLKNANLKRAGFGGTDLADADLSGADLRGVDLSGAYIEGAKFDGEFISAKPYENVGLTDIEKDVYVEDTVKPKEAILTKEVSIGQRKDFQETPPAIRKDTEITEQTYRVEEQENGLKESQDTSKLDMTPQGWKVNEQKGAAKKSIQPIQDVVVRDNVKDENISEVKTFEEGESQLVAAATEKSIEKIVEKSLDKPESTKIETVKTVTPMKDVVKKDVPKPLATVLIPENTENNTREQTVGFWTKVKSSLGLDDTVNEAEMKDNEVIERVESKIAQADMISSEDLKTEINQESPIDVTQPSTSGLVAGIPKNGSGESDDLWEKVEDTQVDIVTETKKTANIEEADQMPMESTSKSEVQSIVGDADSINESNVIDAPKDELENDLLRKLSQKKKCYHCDLKNLNFLGMDLENGDFEGTDFSGSNLSGVNFKGANLRATKFIESNLKGANLQKSDLYKSIMRGADLTDAQLQGSLMDDADISKVLGLQVESVLIR